MKRNKKNLIRSFIPFYKPYRRTFILDMLCSLVVAGVDLLFPMLVRLLMNEGLNTETGMVIPTVIKVVCALLILRIVDMLCYYFVSSHGHIMGVKMEMDIRTKLFNKLLVMPHSYYDDHKIGQLMSRLTNDLFEITEFAHHCPEQILISGIKVIGSFIFLSTINVWLTLVVFALLPFMLVFVMIYNRKMRAAFVKSRAEIGNINAGLEDTLSGIRVVKSFAREDIERNKFRANNERFRDIKKESYHYMGVFHSGTRFFDGLLYIFVVAAGSFFVYLGKIDLVDLVTYLLFISTLLSSISQIVQFTEQFQRGMSGYERYLEIMEEPVAIQNGQSAREVTRVRGEIDFRDVSFCYGEGKEILHGINLHVSAGESIAIAGPSGGGKTTLVNLIPRFYERTKGELTIDGVAVEEYTLQSLRENIGVVQQDVYLFGDTVAANIAYAKPSATQEEIEEAARRAGAHEFILGLQDGYSTYVGERGVKLSGGQKQRIAIARVFLKNPPILILDEATSALDNENEHIVQKSLEELSKGRTTLTIAHRLTTIKNADRILVLTENGIEEEGTHEELKSIPNGIYASMYELYKS
ncbi:MAG: ABC transporter ATP-binding protein [Clostridia bacterium]|nr:ABC transporter ATP-binding protein [Clostridia bacterium]